MSKDLILLLNQLVTPNGRIMDALYGGAQAALRATVMRLVTGNPKMPKSKCGANAVFEALCSLANVDSTHSQAGREALLVEWILDKKPTAINQ